SSAGERFVDIEEVGGSIPLGIIPSRNALDVPAFSFCKNTYGSECQKGSEKMTEKVASLVDADKFFFFKQVLNNINLDIYSGEILGLIGPSGSGKATCIRCLLGMEGLSEGQSYIFEQKMPHRKTMNKIGYMGQETALYESLTAHENMTFVGKLKKLKREDLTHEIDKNLELIDLSGARNKFVSQYSGGMKRRLSLAITLLGQPDIIVLDEPTVGIDPKLRRSIWEQLRTLRDSEKALVITTHVMAEAEQCDKIALLVNGEIHDYGTPKDLMNKYGVTSIEEVFLNLEVTT